MRTFQPTSSRLWWLASLSQSTRFWSMGNLVNPSILNGACAKGTLCHPYSLSLGWSIYLECWTMLALWGPLSSTPDVGGLNSFTYALLKTHVVLKRRFRLYLHIKPMFRQDKGRHHISNESSRGCSPLQVPRDSPHFKEDICSTLCCFDLTRWLLGSVYGTIRIFLMLHACNL